MIASTAGAFLAAAAPAPAAAEEANAAMAVSATVEASCSVSAGGIRFGSIDLSADAAPAATGTVRVLCSSGTAWSASAAVESGQVRRMRGAAGELLYQLYTDSGRSRVWGDGSGGTSSLTGSGNGAEQSYQIHGQILPNQPAVRAGDYSGVVAVTVTY